MQVRNVRSYLLSLFIFSSLIFSQDVTLSFGNVDDGSGNMEIYMESSEDVYGFQFDVTGVTVDAASLVAGDMVPGDWMISGNESGTILGFSLMATFIPAGSGTLVSFSYSSAGGDICIENGVVSGAGGEGLTVGFGDCLEAAPEPSEIELSFSGFENKIIEISMDNSVDVAGFQMDLISSNVEDLTIDI